MSGNDYILDGFIEKLSVNVEKKIYIRAVDKGDNETVFAHTVKVEPPAVVQWKLNLKNGVAVTDEVKQNAGVWYAKGQFKVEIGGALSSAPTGGASMTVEITKKGSPDTQILASNFFDNWTGNEPKITISGALKEYTVKSGLDDGNYKIKIRATDGQAKELNFTVDGTQPTITLAPSGDGVLPAHDSWVSTKALFVAGSADDATSGIEKIEAIVNSGTPKLLGTESLWSGYLTLAEGDNTVQFRVTDKAGNYAETTPRTIKVDINPPTIGLTTPANGQALIKDSTSKVFVKVNVSDSGGSNIQKVEYATSIDFVGATDKTPSNGAAEIELTNINSNTTYYFRAVDNAGNKSDSVQVRVQKDNTPPTVEFESHQNDAKVNKKIKIRGSAGDTRELASVKIVNVTTGTDADLIGVSGSSGADSGKAEFTGTLAYSWHFDLDTTQYSDNADLKLKAIATDAAGNTTEKILTLNVDQDSDRPVVTINSFDHLHAAKLAGTRKISGVIEDDDGAVKKVEIKIGNEGYVDAVMSAGNTLWSIEVPASVGDNSAINFKIKVTDAKDSVFESSNEQANEQALKQPKLSGEKDTNTIGTDFTFVLDTQPPEIMKDGVRYTLGASYGTDEKVLASNEVIGNKNSKKFSIRVFAYDKSGIGSVSVKLGTAAVKTGAHTSASDITAADGKKFEAWDITDIDLTEEGAVKLEITVKDTSGFGKEWSETIRTDFTEPTIKKTAPTDDTVAFKDMTIVGEFTDIPGKPGIAVAGIVPDSLMYHIGNSGWVKKHEANGKVLSELTKAGSTWEIKINDFSEYKTQGATAPTLPSKIWKITLKLKGKDAAGNEVESTGYTLQFDPDGSTPMIEILSPHNDDKLGTGVTISGIARTANPAATDKVTKIKLKLRKSDGTSLTIGTDNYGTGVDIVSKSDINFWSYTLPQNVVTKILDEKKDAEVFFQVQGVAGSTTGDWTVERKFSISKDVAQFSEIKLNEETYAPVSKWIKGNTFHITGEITHSSGIVSATTSSTNLPSGVQALQGAGTKSWFTDITNGKKFDIPIDTTQYLEKAGEIEFTISAKDGRTDGTAKEVFTTIRLKYDNSTPLASIGKIGLSKYNDKANKADFTGGVFTDFVGVIKDTNRELYTVMVNQKKYAVSSIVKEGDNYKVTLDNASSLNGTGLYYMIVKKYDIISGANFKFEGSVEDSGSGPVKIEAELTIAGTTGKAEAQATSKNEAGNLYSFSGNLDTTTVSNGKGTLKITVTDGAGNQTSEAIPVRVKNNPLKINKITFNTDLSGDGNYGASTDEVHVPSLPTDSLTDGDYRCTIDVSSVFAYKNKSKSELVIELMGGYGSSRTVKLYKGSIHADNEVTSGTGTTTQPNVITLNLNGCFANENEASTTLKNKIGDKADQKLILVVTDEVAGNPKPWYAQMDITVAVDVKDDVQPTGYIMPMYYNSKTDNSVGKTIEWEDSEETTVKSMTEHGHIEYSKIASINNDYQSLSGKVVLRGIAYDNIRLSKIELTGADTNISNTYESGAWKPSSNLKIVSEKIMNTGHYVEWEYVWDTGTPEKAHEITVKVTDAAGKTNDSGAEAPADLTGTRETDLKVFVVNKDTVKKGQFISFADGESLYVVQVTEVTAKDGAPTKEKLRWEKVNGNSKRDVPSALTSGKLYAGTSQKKSEKFNIVPYVTSLARGAKYNTNRSTSGAYNIMRKDPNAVSTNPNTGLVTVTGYNLKGIVTATIPGVASSQSVSENAGVFTFTVPSDAKSGSVTITANSIAAINNQTNNSREYNKQNKPNRPETDLWTDDIAIDVWDDDTTANEFPGSKNPVYPSMAMGSNGSLYAAFSNYSESKVYYSKLGESAATQVFYAYDPPEEAAISVSGTDTVNILYSANYHGGTPSNWAQAVTGAGGLYCYDEHAQEIIFNGSGYNAKKGKFHRFELFYHNKQLQQFKNFRIVRGGNDRIHIAYYDTLSNAIKYATVMNNANPHDKNHEYPWINLDGGSDSDDTKSYTGGASAVLSEANYETDGTKKRAGSTAEHCTIALDNGNKPVVVYADIDTGTLRLARASSAAPTAASDWKVQKVLAAGDSNAGLASDYFTAKIDSSGYLHIAFRNTRGQLCYVKSTNAPTGGAAYAFATSEIIDDSGLWADLTLDGTTPYISYMSKPNAYDGIRIAYFDNNLVKTWNNDGTEKDKGGWNKVTVALQNRANNVRTCIAVAPSTVTDWKAAVGYTPGNVYRVVKYVK